MLLGTRLRDDHRKRGWMAIPWKPMGRSRCLDWQKATRIYPDCNLPSKGHFPSPVQHLYAGEGSVRKSGYGSPQPTPSRVWLGHRSTILVLSGASVRLGTQDLPTDGGCFCPIMSSIRMHGKILPPKSAVWVPFSAGRAERRVFRIFPSKSSGFRLLAMSDLKPISVRDRLAFFSRKSYMEEASLEENHSLSSGLLEKARSEATRANVGSSGFDEQWPESRLPPRMAPPPTPPSITTTPVSFHPGRYSEAWSSGKSWGDSGKSASTAPDSCASASGVTRSARRLSIIRTPVPQSPSPPTPLCERDQTAAPMPPTRLASDVAGSLPIEQASRPPLASPARVLCIVYDYVEDTEFFVAEAALRTAGFEVDVASPSAPWAGSVVRSVVRVSDETAGEAVLRAADLDGHRIVTTVDFLRPASSMNGASGMVHPTSVHQEAETRSGHMEEQRAIQEYLDRYAALILPGGRISAALTVAHWNPSLLRLIQAFHANGRLIAAISTAPVLLSAAGLTATGEPGISLTAHPLVKADIYPPSAFLQQIDWDADGQDQHRNGTGTANSEAPASVAVADANVVTAACWQGHPQYLSQVLSMLGVTVFGNDLRVLVLTESGCELTEVLASVQVLQTLGLAVDVALPPPANAAEAGSSRRRRFFTVLREFEARPSVCGQTTNEQDPQVYHERPCRSFEASIPDVTSISPFDYDGILVTGGSSAWRIRNHERVLHWLAKPLLRTGDAGHARSHPRLAHSTPSAGSDVASKRPGTAPGARRPILGAIGEGSLVLIAATRAAGSNTSREVTGYPGYVPPGSGFIFPKTPFDIHQDGHVISCASWLAIPEFLRVFLQAMGCEICY
jgi:putative intracellular protease/amidase